MTYQPPKGNISMARYFLFIIVLFSTMIVRAQPNILLIFSDDLNTRICPLFEPKVICKYLMKKESEMNFLADTDCNIQFGLFGV